MMRLEHLPNKRPGEHVEVFLRRHWFVVVKTVLIPVLMVGIPTILLAIFWPFVEPYTQNSLWGPLMTLVAWIYVMSVWLLSFVEFTDYFLDTWIVTNERIFNIEQFGLFHRVASELHLAQVEDVTAETSGIMQTMFGYGNVHIQTAAEAGRFFFKGVSNPESVKQKILALAHEDRVRHQAG